MAELFNISMASDLSEWSSVVVDSGDLSWASGAGLGGTAGGASLLIDDTNAIYMRYDFSALSTQTDYRIRVYLDPNTLSMGSGEEFDLVRVESSSSVATCRLRLANVSGVLKFRHQVLDDAGLVGGTEDINLSSLSEYFEVWVTKATGASANDATSKLYFDGSLVSTLSGVDLYNNFAAMVRVKIGCVTGLDASTSGTMYIDECVMRDDSTVIGGLNVNPILTVPGAQRYIIGVAEVVSGISFTDPDDDESVMTFTCNKGTFAAPTPTNVDVSGSGTATMTLTGTRTELNAYCAAGNGPTYTHTTANHDADTITVNIDDQVGTPDEATIAVTAVDWRITALNMADLNATFRNFQVTEASEKTVGLSLYAVDSGGRTGTAQTTITVSADVAVDLNWNRPTASIVKARRRDLVHRPQRNRFRWRT